MKLDHKKDRDPFLAIYFKKEIKDFGSLIKSKSKHFGIFESLFENGMILIKDGYLQSNSQFDVNFFGYNHSKEKL